MMTKPLQASGPNFKAGLMKLFSEQELRITAGEKNGRQLGMEKECGGAAVSNFLQHKNKFVPPRARGGAGGGEGTHIFLCWHLCFLGSFVALDPSMSTH